MKVYTWRYFGSLAFAVSWFLHFLLLSLFACFCERNWHMFSTSVLISPFLGSENSISGHLLKPILPLYLLDLCFSPPLHPSTCPSPLNTLIPLSEKNLRGRKCGAERIKWSWGDGRGHDEELGGGRSERQMDGEKEHVHQIDASNSSWLLSYLAVSFFKTTLKFNCDCLFQLHLIFACKDQN